MELIPGDWYKITTQAGVFRRFYARTEWCEFDNEAMIVLGDDRGKEKPYPFAKIKQIERAG